MAIHFLLPAYNESLNISPLLKKIRELSGRVPMACRVWMVDDGSLDGTGAAARSAAQGLELEVLPHRENRGLAEALRTGLNRILENAQPEDWVAVMDADNSHDPLLVAEMLRKAESGADGVIASRYVAGAREVGLSALRRALSGVCNAFLRLRFPIEGVTDYSSGYRLLRAAKLRDLRDRTSGKFFKAQGFVCTSELLINLAATGARFAEIPLLLRYDLKQGKSKMKIGRTIRDYLALAVSSKV